MIGLDAFLGLPSWYRWQELLQFSHFAVIARSCEQVDFSPEIQHLLSENKRKFSR